jgi:hypothetical protein
MLNKKEAFIIFLIIVIIGLSLSLSLNATSWKTILAAFAAVAVVVLANIFAKKIAAYNLDTEIEMKIWEAKNRKIAGGKKSFPIGAILPPISKLILFPFNSFVWMASLVFDVKPRIYKGAKRYGLYTFSEMTEYHLGLIAAAGVFANLVLSVVGYFLGFPLFARLSMYYAFFHILPLSELDGNKIFFGNLVLWSFLAALVLIGMLFAIFIV